MDTSQQPATKTNFKWGSFWALIGTAASVISIYAFVSGKASLREAFQGEAATVGTPAHGGGEGDEKRHRVPPELMWTERTASGQSRINFKVPLSEEGQTRYAESSFTLPVSKGLLGSSANALSAAGFMNSEKTLFGINHQPVTKTSYVYLFKRNPDGTMMMISDVNEKVSRLLPKEWQPWARGFLRIEYIERNEICFQVVDFAPPGRACLNFLAAVDRTGGIRFTNITDQWTEGR